VKDASVQLQDPRALETVGKHLDGSWLRRTWSARPKLAGGAGGCSSQTRSAEAKLAERASIARSASVGVTLKMVGTRRHSDWGDEFETFARGQVRTASSVLFLENTGRRQCRMLGRADGMYRA